MERLSDLLEKIESERREERERERMCMGEKKNLGAIDVVKELVFHLRPTSEGHDECSALSFSL